jgi:hypothetical protein
MNMPHHVLVWGPHGVGKTALISALACEMSWLNNNSEDGSKYELLDQDGQVVKNFWMDDYAFPTQYPRDYIYKFKGNFPNRSLKAIEHQITVFDDKGSTLVETLSDLSNGIARLSIKNSRFLIAIIDPTIVFESQKLSMLKSSDPAFLVKRSDYLDYLRRLISIMGQNTSERRYIAICMSKMDLLELRWKDPKILVELCFGESFLNDINWHKRHNIVVQYFSTSAYGFFWDSNYNEFPNFDITSGMPKFKEEWRPWNVTAPFFWMFNQIEQETLNTTADYPGPFY